MQHFTDLVDFNCFLIILYFCLIQIILRHSKEKQQQYHVDWMGTGRGGKLGGLGRQASWAMHESVYGVVHGCMMAGDYGAPSVCIWAN